MPLRKRAGQLIDEEDASGSDGARARPRSLGRNEVHLSGRVAAAPVERELPSGDSVVTVRLIVERDGPAAARTSQRVDTIDCVGWTARVQRAMRRWQAGDEVEVSGALRRRFYRVADGPRSRFEVEVSSARRAR
jgi:single-strand DNA-binding protein